MPCPRRKPSIGIARPSWLVWLRGLCLGLGACGAAMGLAALGGAVSVHLDLLTHLLPLWSLLGLGGALGAAALSRQLGRQGRGLAPLGLALTTLACAIALAAPDYLPGPAPDLPVGPHQRLRLIQLNVWKHNQDQARTADWVLAQGPDIVVLEEVFAQNLPLVRRLRARLPYRVSCTGRDSCSTTILSRVAPSAWGGLKDLSSPTPLAGAWATYPSPAGPFSIVAAQLSWPAPPADQQARARVLVQAARRLDRGDVIVAGDFNTTSWSYALRRLDRDLGLRRVTRGLPTWPARGFLWAPRSVAFMPIDQVYLGSNWRLARLRRGERLGSDHYPLILDLQRSLVQPRPSLSPPGQGAVVLSKS
jgi:endonuclease/exonuclease/phosphatase (EEP) superfamily protein YafD